MGEKTIMAVAKMGSDEKKKGTTLNPSFHDFLGMKIGGSYGGGAAEVEASVSASIRASSGGHGIVSVCSDVCSEKQALSNFEGFRLQSRKNDMFVPKDTSKLAGRKRCSRDSAIFGLVRDGSSPTASDSTECTGLMKMLGKKVTSEWPQRSSNPEAIFLMKQSPKPNSTSLILHPPLSSRSDPAISKLEQRSFSINSRQMICYPSKFSQGVRDIEKISSCDKGINAGQLVVSQPAADEGSRTGINGAGILDVINPRGATTEEKPDDIFPSSSKVRVSTQVTETVSSSIPSRNGIEISTRQMTIFYAGQAHVFDDVHPNKADVIMALAGPKGGACSTTYVKSRVPPPSIDAKTPAENRVSSLAFSQNPASRLSIQMNNSQSHIARFPVAVDFRNTTTGVHQGVGDIRDPRLRTLAKPKD